MNGFSPKDRSLYWNTLQIEIWWSCRWSVTISMFSIPMATCLYGASYDFVKKSFPRKISHKCHRYVLSWWSGQLCGTSRPPSGRAVCRWNIWGGRSECPGSPSSCAPLENITVEWENLFTRKVTEQDLSTSWQQQPARQHWQTQQHWRFLHHSAPYYSILHFTIFILQFWISKIAIFC